ncbi:uncharacterized protein LOC127130183 [Lathyrus oleraceus]|uniref:uncharacterized protein LOC127130183 n=1 Tax=Pisum sativum TaxID=3888 RepID=UPI0021CE04BF|nr:uncharacterized protein LOC127130183 [Pisum sativum]
MQLRVFGSVIGSKEKALRNAFHAQKQVCPVRCYLLESLEADILSPSSLQKQNSEAPFDVDSKMKIDATAAVEIGFAGRTSTDGGFAAIASIGRDFASVTSTGSGFGGFAGTAHYFSI